MGIAQSEGWRMVGGFFPSLRSLTPWQCACSIAKSNYHYRRSPTTCWPSPIVQRDSCELLTTPRIWTVEKWSLHDCPAYFDRQVLSGSVDDWRLLILSSFSPSSRYLSENHLTTIPQGVLDKMTYLKVVRLDANPLHCDCSLKWLFTFIKAKRVPVQFAAVCQTPSHLYGKAFGSLQATDFKCSK